MEGQDRVLHFIPGQFTGDVKLPGIRFPEEIESGTLLVSPFRKYVRRVGKLRWRSLQLS